MIKYAKIHVVSCASPTRRLEESIAQVRLVAGDLLFLDALDVADHIRDSCLDLRFALSVRTLVALGANVSSASVAHLIRVRNAGQRPTRDGSAGLGER